MIFDLQKSYCHYFNEICKIPHGSRNEKQLSDWLVRFASDHGYRSIQDNLHNVIIYKPASPGYEGHPGVIIQAHMDMVCEKTADSTHDFTTEPLELYVEDDKLRARGTSLGADDGMGCAYMLAILDDASLKHPFLECCFTTREEVGMDGALALKLDYFQARQLINLDGAGEYRTYVSMGGGKQVSIKKKIHLEPVSLPTYQLKIDGLLGGHSGGMIDKERANANKLAARILYHLLLRGIEIQLVSLNGGTKANVIANSAAARFSSSADPAQMLAIANDCARDIATEYEFSDAGIRVSLDQDSGRASMAMPVRLSREVIELLYLLPYGQKARSVVFENLPIASVNPGLVTTQDDHVEMVELIRSAIDSWACEIETEVALLAKIYGADTEQVSSYPGWKYEAKSPLRDKMCEVFQEMYQKPLQCLAGHGGNECGVFKKLDPAMDIVTSGAIYGQIHSTDEFLDLASFDRAYVFLTGFLAKL